MTQSKAISLHLIFEVVSVAPQEKEKAPGEVLKSVSYQEDTENKGVKED